MADQLTTEQIINIAENQRVKKIVVFENNHQTPPSIFLIDKINPVHENAIMIIYGYARVYQYLKYIDVRIGTHKTIVARSSDPSSCKNTVSGYIIGNLQYHITCGYQTTNSKNGKISVFCHKEMLPCKHSARYSLIVDADPIDKIELYFEISVILDTETKTAEYEHIQAKETVIDRQSQLWYNQKQILKCAGFDNPFGPYTNYIVNVF